MGYNNSDGVYLSNTTGGSYEGYNRQGGTYEGGTTGGEYEDQQTNQEYSGVTRAEQAALDAIAAREAAELAETNAEAAADSINNNPYVIAVGSDLAGSGWNYDLGLITDVADELGNGTTDGYIETVAVNIDSVIAVANDLPALQDVLTNLPEILLADDYAAEAALSASSASTSANTATTQASISTTQAGIATTQAGIATTKALEASTSETNAATSATASATSATASASSATSASTSATTATTQAGVASDAATLATTKASEASTSATQASTSATNAASSASSASTYASNASTSASAASTSAIDAANSAFASATSATNASDSATSASTSASTATIKAGEASASATAAAGSASDAALTLLQVEQIFDNFDDIYLGSKASDPTVDNDGDPLVAGQVYWNTTESEIRFYNGTVWERPEYAASQSALAALNSANAAASSATASASSATASASSASDALTSANNADTSEANAASSASSASTSASTATTQAGIATTQATNAANSASSAATSETNAATSATNAAASASDAADSAAEALATLGLSLLKANNLSDLANVITARTNLGLGTAATTDSTAYATAAQGTNADTAYGWGNHALVGYLTTETDPIYVASSWYTTINNSSNWNTAYGWGNHALVGYAMSGANTDITSLSGITGDIGIADSLTFDTAAAEASAVGKTFWDDGNGTLGIGLKGGNVTLQVGQEVLVRAYNDSGSALVDGEIVYISGSQGNRVAVKRALADSDTNSLGTIGMVTEPIASGAEGFVTHIGVVNGLDTSALVAGAPVYLSGTVAGGYTTIKPVAPTHLVTVGWVQRVHATAGSIYINIENGYELDELHDVYITSAATNDFLVRNSSNLWVNQTPSTARTSMGLGALATLNTVGTTQIDNSAVTVEKLAAILDLGSIV